MTAYLALCDDDSSWKTTEDMLSRVHDHAVNNGFKVSFGVVPCMEQKKPNNEAVRYIKSIKGDVLLHGFNHPEDYPEFRTNNVKFIDYAISEGLNILKKEFGKVPTVFVCPHEDCSKQAWDLLKRYDLAICRTVSFFGWVRRTPIRDLPIKELLQNVVRNPRFVYKRSPINYPVFQISAGFSTLRSPDIELKNAKKALDYAISNDTLCQIVMHYWEFNDALLKAYHDFIDYAATCDVVPVTLSECVEKELL